MYVYVISSPIQNAMKIGYTQNNPILRLRQLQTGNPEPLFLVRSYRVIDPSALETHLHQHYKDVNVSDEWFNPSVLETIDQVVSNWVLDQTHLDIMTLKIEAEREVIDTELKKKTLDTLAKFGIY